ncbi:hypothetical protein GJA_5203 [Janthinobacterium agaricidamnosum NBRC 102515 = DSM 9628]|uniref:Uncharacterized protein n=1 Tax=Janthinobacterium agaricidamnosum NBRC 102515 = DSM 9628 TaxID=1349767 RepID=W0VDQ0_9BURK|nr:hypothetical protein GJA_5203 [Janthinobacterium agaricidamnosum NBRC 102515 = DSM 9628]
MKPAAQKSLTSRWLKTQAGAVFIHRGDQQRHGDAGVAGALQRQAGILAYVHS